MLNLTYFYFKQIQIYNKMNDLSKPSTIFQGVNTLGLITTAVYFSRQNAALNVKINDTFDEIDTIKEGLKDKVPKIENSVKTLEMAMRSLSQNLQNIGHSLHTSDKKVSRARGEVTEISDTLDALDTRFVNLVEALIAKNIISKEDVDPPSKQIFRTRQETRRVSGGRYNRDDEDEEPRDSRRNTRGDSRRDRRPVRDDTEDESDSRSEDERRHRRTRSVPAPRRPIVPSNDDDDIDVVARMASRK